MMAFLALGMGFKDREWRWAWLATGTVFLLTMLMTGSRTAVAAAGLVGVLVFARIAASHSSYRVRAVSAACVVLAVGTAFFLVFRTTGATPSVAVGIRWVFLQTTARMLLAEPAFGVGIGQYSPASGHFGPPALFQLWRPDNAHNNLAQIAGELGLIGLITFLLVLAASFRVAIRHSGPQAISRTSDRRPRGVYPDVAWRAPAARSGSRHIPSGSRLVCWLRVASDSKPHLSAGVIGIAVALLLVSIPFRVGAKSAQLDFSRVTYGVSAKQLMTSRARFFVPATKSRVEFPLRARSASDDEPVEIDVLVDGSASDTITLTDRNWRRTPINLSGDSSRRFHQIDLRIRPDTLDNLDPGRSSVEVGKWEIIPKPNG